MSESVILKKLEAAANKARRDYESKKEEGDRWLRKLTNGDKTAKRSEKKAQAEDKAFYRWLKAVEKVLKFKKAA